jgi:hydrogenase nickel incorporation protein HypA/HybF
MHEWALAESVVTTVIETAKKEKLKKIDKVNIRLGELQQIEQGIFKFALQEIIVAQNGMLRDVKIDIETENTTLSCRNCGHRWCFGDIKEKLGENESEAIHFVPEVALVHTRCPKCGSPDFNIITGRGVSITSITGMR